MTTLALEQSTEGSVLTEQLPLQVRFGSSRPASFQTGAPVRIYSLLGGGLIRDYVLRDPDPHQTERERLQVGFIQVVAHVRRDLADEEADRFLKYGWSAAVFSVEIDGRIFHRVLIGPFASPQEAGDVRALARETAAALEYIKAIMAKGRVEAVQNAQEGSRIVLPVAGEVQQTAGMLEAFGWSVLKIETQAIHIGPFPDKQNAMNYRQNALGGMGWGPRKDLLD